MVLSALAEEKIIQQNIFVPSEVAQIISDFYRGKNQNLLKVWYLFMFQLWYAEWMK
jgi:asparagine synthase (glutamine-hydrolysing)